MAYDEDLAERIRRALEGRSDVEERHMFGGVAFMLRNHMCCGVVQSRLMVRLDPDTSDDLLRRPNVAPMDFTGRPMRGFLFVDGEAVANDEDLSDWLDRAVAYVESIPEEPIGIEDEGIGEPDDDRDEEPVWRRRPAARAVAARAKAAKEIVASVVEQVTANPTAAKKAVKKAATKAVKKAAQKAQKRAQKTKATVRRRVRKVERKVKRAVRKVKRAVRKVKRAARGIARRAKSRVAGARRTARKAVRRAGKKKR